MSWLEGSWLDGSWHDGGVVPFDVADRGLLLGDGVFDTSLVLGGKMVWRQAHVDRLRAATRALGFALDASRVEAAIDATLTHMTHGSLRLTVTRGTGPRGLAPPTEVKPTILATHAPLRASALFAPLKLHVASIRRNETSPTSRIKSLNYLDGILASREAIAAGCDDTLFLNTKDRVACTSIGNVFALIGDQLVTPPVDDGAVPGIARAVLLRGCEDLGLEPVERSLTLDDFEAADEILVCNSLRLLAPVTAIGRKARPSMRRSEALAAYLAHQVRGEVGIDPRRIAEG